MKIIFRFLITGLSLLLALKAYSQTTTGAKLTDFGRGVEFVTPSSTWDVNVSSYSITLNHNVNYDVRVTLNKMMNSVSTTSDAYSKRKENLKSYLPGAIFIKENEPVTLAGGVAAVSMTYKNPADLTITRVIVFLHKNQGYELEFKAKEENFGNIKTDFGAILQGVRLF